MKTREATIGDLRELVQSASRNNPHLTSRLEKATFLLLLRRVASVGKERYEVGSEDGLRNYRVVNGHCDCHDYVSHGIGHPCKHRLALALYLKLELPDSPSSVDDESLMDFVTLASQIRRS